MTNAGRYPQHVGNELLPLEKHWTVQVFATHLVSGCDDRTDIALVLDG